MDFSVETIHKRIVDICNEEVKKYGNLRKVAEQIHLDYQRLWDTYRGRRNTKQMPVDIIANFVYHLDYSPYFILFGILPEKKTFNKQ